MYIYIQQITPGQLVTTQLAISFRRLIFAFTLGLPGAMGRMRLLGPLGFLFDEDRIGLDRMRRWMLGLRVIGSVGL